jgi:hypothetical protein
MKRRRPIDVPPKVPTYAVVPVDEAAVADALKAHLIRSLSSVPSVPGAADAFVAVMEATELRPESQVGIYTALVRQAFPRLSAAAQHALVTALVMTHSPIARSGLQQVTPAVLDALSAACAEELTRRRAGERQTS